MSPLENALAGHVALRIDDWQPSHGCPAWIESASKQCARTPLADSMLCKRHRNIAIKRHEKLKQDRQTAQQRRAEHRAQHLPQWRAELARIEAEIDRRDQPITTDRAAFGGNSHPSIRKKQLAALSDTNVQRMAQLHREATRLREKIGADTK